MIKYLPAEWAEQDFVQLSWPHENTDWAYMLDEVNICFAEIANCIHFSSPTDCAVCQSGFFLATDKKRWIANLSNCYLMKNETQCQICLPGYSLNSNDQCAN